MGYTLTPIAVDLAKVTALIGSKDSVIADQLAIQLHEEFESIDALGDDWEEPDDGDAEELDDEARAAGLLKLGRFLESAKQQLLTGEPPDRVLGKLDDLANVSE